MGGRGAPWPPPGPPRARTARVTVLQDRPRAACAAPIRGCRHTARPANLLPTGPSPERARVGGADPRRGQERGEAMLSAQPPGQHGPRRPRPERASEHARAAPRPALHACGRHPAGDPRMRLTAKPALHACARHPQAIHACAWYGGRDPLTQNAAARGWLTPLPSKKPGLSITGTIQIQKEDP